MQSDRASAVPGVRLFQRLAFVIAAVFVACAAVKPTEAGPLFIAYLDGDQEVPPSGSAATGVATFQFDDAITELYYELHVTALVDITQAHIHLAPAGFNGPVVLWLYPSAPPPQLIPGQFDGLLASGTVTSADLIGPLAGEPLTALRDAMAAGNAYVNVHTLAFPPGEIRGQIQVPEPTTLAVIGLGLAVFGVLRRRRVA